MGRRVVVTGLGVLSPVGLNVSEFWQSLVAGRSGIGPITSFDPAPYRCRIAGELKGFNPDVYVTKQEQKWLDPFLIYAVAATRMSLADSGLDLSHEDRARVGVVVGSGVGGIQSVDTQFRRLLARGPGRVSPFFIPSAIIDMVSGYLSMVLGAMGPSYGVVAACATGTQCVGEGCRGIQRGDSDIVFCGGTDAAITPIVIAGFGNMRALSTRNDEPQRASRPFDKGRDGFVLGEGAGIVVLEESEHALKRGARIYAEVIGYGASADAYHIAEPCPDGEGAALSMWRALQDAGVRPEEIDYINAHGTSTDLNDKSETRGVKRVFGERAYRVPLSSNKSMIGHLLGASGAIQFAATVLTIREGVIPPTINYEVPDPDCDLDYVPNVARRHEVRVALCNSLGLGGHNATLVARRFEA